MPPSEYTQFGVAGLFVFGMVWCAKIIAPALLKASGVLAETVRDSTKELKTALSDSDKRHGQDLDKILDHFTRESAADADSRHRQANVLMIMVGMLERIGIHVPREVLAGLTKPFSEGSDDPDQKPTKSQ